jgi:hypothetical protein
MTMALLRQCLQQLRMKQHDWDVPQDAWPETKLPQDRWLLAHQAKPMLPIVSSPRADAPRFRATNA